MTDSRIPPQDGRADLRALAPSQPQADRVIGAVMAGLATRPRGVARSRPGPLEIVGLSLPPAWIAAAALLLTAVSFAVLARRGPTDSASVGQTVATWATQEHVPTNAELLAAFQGYAE